MFAESLESKNVQKPSAKNIILIASAAIIIGAAFAVSRYENPTYTVSTPQNNTGLQLPVISASASSTDEAISAGADWAKTLSTVATGWNNGTTPTKIATSNATLTPTQTFGQDLFSTYFAAQSSGQDLTDPNVQQAIVNKVMADGTVLPSPKLYSQSDFTVSQDNSVTALTAYGNDLGLVYVSNFVKHNGDLDIVQAALDANNPDLLKQLDTNIAEYQGMLQGALTVKVPSAMASAHLSFINGLSELVFADRSFEKTFSDGLTSLNAIAAYQQGMSDLGAGLRGIENNLHFANISYTSMSDPGIIFTYYYKSQ